MWDLEFIHTSDWLGPIRPRDLNYLIKYKGMSLCMGYMTAANKKEAKGIVSLLLKESLIACANIFDQIESHFMWQNKLTQKKEVVVIFKTRIENEQRILEIIKTIHSYECPCLIFLPITGGHADFLNWIEEQC